MNLLVRKETEYEHDYELVDNEEHERKDRLSIIAKPMQPLDILKMFNFRKVKTQDDEEEEEKVDD